MSGTPPPSYDQPANAILDYVVDWSAWLFADDSIGSATWEVDQGLTQPATPSSSFTTTTATIWLSGGVAGTTYLVKSIITTVVGRVMEQEFSVTVEDA